MVWVGGGRGWRGDHLLVGELELLLDSLDIPGSVLGNRRLAGIGGEVRGKGWFATCSDHRSGESMRLMRYGVEGLHYSLDFVYSRLGRGAF